MDLDMLALVLLALLYVPAWGCGMFTLDPLNVLFVCGPRGFVGLWSRICSVLRLDVCPCLILHCSTH